MSIFKNTDLVRVGTSSNDIMRSLIQRLHDLTHEKPTYETINKPPRPAFRILNEIAHDLFQ